MGVNPPCREVHFNDSNFISSVNTGRGFSQYKENMRHELTNETSLENLAYAVSSSYWLALCTYLRRNRAIADDVLI